MKVYLFLLVLPFLLTGCQEKVYTVELIDNPFFHPNVEFKGFEDLSHPGFQTLQEKYRLDTIFHGETDEFKRILLLRNWIKTVISIDDFGDPYPGGGSVEGILDAALQGTGFHCGHFMKVQNAILNAYGYVTRTLGAGAGVKGGPDGHHGINEIWLNSCHKWFLSDAKYDHHFEKNGIPLSALEIRDEYLKNEAADITLVKGPYCVPIERDPETGSTKEQSAQTYTWVEFHTYNNIYTVWPEHQTMLSFYEDDYFINHTWIWDDKPHWAYDKPEFMRLVKDRNAIEWTPNTIASEVQLDGERAMIRLVSETPNLKYYQMKEGMSGDWHPVEESFSIGLRKYRHELRVRTLNLAGVTGPEHKIVIRRRQAAGHASGKPHP
jgi:hypothetical protein